MTYENIKYEIIKIKNQPGPQFEVVVHWLETNTFEHIFFKDRLLEEDKFIDEIDNMWEQFHSSGDDVEKIKKIEKLDDARKKYIKKEVKINGV